MTRIINKFEFRGIVGGTAIQMMMEMFNELANRLEGLECQDHSLKISYVVTSTHAARHFLCNQCMANLDQKTKSRGSIVDLRDYIRGLKDMSMNESIIENPEESLLSETGKALEVTERLTQDLTESLEGVRKEVSAYYKHSVSMINKNGVKCMKHISHKIDHTLKRNLLELSGIERNLKIIQEGNNPINPGEVLDMAINYASKRSTGDNALYDLLTGLNPIETAQSTHKRLTHFSKRYFKKKTEALKQIKRLMIERFRRDDKLLKHLISKRSKLLQNVNESLSVAQLLAARDEKKSILGRERLAGGNEISKEDKRKTRKATSRTRDTYLGKRVPEDETYDPKTSFNRVFCKKNKLCSIDKMFEIPKVDGLKTSQSRLSEALKRRPTQMSRLQSQQLQVGQESVVQRLKSKRVITPYRNLECLEPHVGNNYEQMASQRRESQPLEPKNMNLQAAAAQLCSLKPGKEYDQNELPARKTSKLYLMHLEEEKIKQQQTLPCSATLGDSSMLKENIPVRTRDDLLNRSKEELIEMIEQIPIKKLNMNDPRHRMLAEQKQRLEASIKN